MGGNSRRNLRMFHELCGTDSLQNVVIVTTMWDRLTTQEEGLQREEELKSSDNLFKPWMDGQAVMMRHKRTTETANEVMNYLLKKGATRTRITHELVEEEKTLVETAAGRELNNQIDELIKSHEKNMNSLNADVRRELEDVQRELGEEKKKMARLSKDLEELKQGMVVAISTLIGPRYVLLTYTYIQLSCKFASGYIGKATGPARCLQIPHGKIEDIAPSKLRSLFI